MMLVREMFESEEDSVIQLMYKCFADEAKSIEGLLRDLFVHPAGKAGRPIVAIKDGAIIGFVFLSVGMLDSFDKNIKVGVLGPLGVHPDFQKQGIGRELISHLLQDANELKLPVVFLEGDPAYYSKSGFEPAKSLGMRKPSIRIPDAAFQCMPLEGHEAWMVGTLVYPEPFWTNDCVGLRNPDFIAWVKKEVSEGREL